jgi:hypothetical protein
MYTDKNLEFNCAECEQPIIGVDAMTAHIMNQHPEYTAAEAVNHARMWADDAYEREEEFERDYNEQRRLDKAIHADTFPHK